MIVIFEQILILFIFVSVGYALGKTKVVNTEHTKIISSLLVYVFLSSNIFKTFAARFSPAYIAQNYKILLVSAAVLVVLVVLAQFVRKLFSKHKYEQCIYEYSLMVPNFGYIGYVLSEALLGQAGLIDFMTFAVPISLYTYTFGFAKLTKRGAQLKKLMNPALIATFLGIIVGLTGIPIPGVLASLLDKASSCMGPVSMVFMGIVISGFSLKNILKDVKAYILALVRLVVIPVLVGLVLSLFCEAHVVQTAVMFYALPCGLNTVIFPKLVDENCQIGAGIALVSTAFSCITLPIILSVFGLS